MPSSEIARLLSDWGDDNAGPTNGEEGRRLLETVLTVFRRVSPSGRVCDLGCGNGYFAHELGQRGYSVVGIDGSSRKLEIARRYHQGANVEFQHGVFGETAPGSATFDAAVSVDVIEHLYRPTSLIETADALLKPHGWLVICTPYHGYLKNVAISVLNRWDSHHHVHFDGGHIKFFSVSTLTKMLSPRFEVVDCEYFGRFPGLWKNMIIVARKRTP
jgi:2-polyprenyl-3-methyl-5-hydroxy-6-metoxy-1,4-benzoquinol methylase